MMTRVFITYLLLSHFAAAALGQSPVGRNYHKLDHQIVLKSLRAGNHDESGVNDYYFKVAMHALLNTAEERKLEFNDKKKISQDLGEFGDIQIDVLQHWDAPDAKESPVAFEIEGDSLRKIISEVMRKHSTKEENVSILVDITLIERGKKFVFFGEDVEIGKTEYYPIPMTSFDTPSRTNQQLTIADDKGLSIQLSVEYKEPLTSARTKTEEKAKESDSP